MSWGGVYGYPHVSDPRDFSPDPECCSDEEMAAHKRACETFGTPDYQQPKNGCVSIQMGDTTAIATRTSWGIGFNSYRQCDGCGEPVGEFLTCHDCGGHLDFCPVCWPEHAKTCEERTP